MKIDNYSISREYILATVHINGPTTNTPTSNNNS
jgi:hypothetical protein